MERLTVRNSEGIGVLKQPFECERCGDLQWSLPDLGNGSPIDRLAEYEDLEERLNQVYGECDGLLEKVIEHLERHEGVDLPEPVFKARLLTDGEVDRWDYYKSLDEEGKLLKLPCAVGDTVYCRCDGIKIAPMRVEQIIISKYGTALLLEYCGDDEQLKHWKINIESTALDCKIVFLTKEEAEAALKELQEVK